ncbi:MAG TPA: Uma2 family endonuclease [Streptosporangiaceae bacterium]|nr:Uma2 family endonuclease [Streptosporangiaceae bacterium]
MSAVTLTDAWPKPGEPFTVSDLDRMPDDGHRYELLDGTLIVSPAPGPPHQRVAVMLCHTLELACPEDLIVFPNVGVRIGPRSALEPDAVVARAADVDGARLARPPLLVAEILSPDSALRDLNLKKAAYERFGIPSYWVVDPDLDQPSLLAFDLVNGEYRGVAQVAGDVPFRAVQPFPAEIVPSRLVAKLRAR